MLQQLAHYSGLEKVGQGGMGVVYRAHDTRLDRTVALKVLPWFMSADPPRRSRFLREARAAAKLNHPNIATIFEVGEAASGQDSDHPDKILYIAMEYVEGEDLSTRLESGGLDLAESLAVGSQIADALAAAHQSGVVHRDLKPHNIRLTPDGRVKILDFGLAKLLPEEAAVQESQWLTREGVIVGTVPYMAPEQVQGSSDSRCDLFALGVVLYQMIAGRLPFASSSLLEYARSLAADSRAPLSQSNPAVSPELEQVVDKLLAREVSERYQTATEVSQDLKALASNLRSDPGGSRRITFPATTSPNAVRTKKRSWLAALGVLLGILVAFCLSFYLISYSGRDRRPDAEIQTLTLVPFHQEGSAEACRGLDKSIANALIAFPKLAVSESPEGALPTSGIALRGECRSADGDGEKATLVLSLFAAQDGQILWGENLELDREANLKVDEAVHRIEHAFAVTRFLRRNWRGSLDPDALKAFNLYSQAETLLENYNTPDQLTAAIQGFSAAIARDPSVPWFHLGASEAYVRRYHKYGDPADQKRAEEKARAAQELDATLPAVRMAIARSRPVDERSVAIAELEKLREEGHYRDQVDLELGHVYEQANEIEKAKYHLRMAVRQRPGNWRYRNQLGSVLLENGEFKEAREHLEAAQRWAPQDVVWPKINLGSLEYLIGNVAGAIALYESIPDHLMTPSLMSNVGSMYFEINNWQAAERWYRRAISHDPSHFLHWGNLSDVYLRAGDAARAKESLTKALTAVQALNRADPSREDLLSFEAKYLAKLGDCRQVGEVVQRINQLLAQAATDVASARTLLRVAQTHAICGHKEAALGALKSAVDRGLSAGQARSFEFAALFTDPDFLAVVASAKNHR